MTAPFIGTYTAIITPFSADLSVDYPSFEALIERQIKAGIEGLVVLGTTGEAPTIHGKEYDAVVRFVIDKVCGRCQVIAGVGGNDTARTIEQARRAQAANVDGLLVTCPYYNKPTQKGLEAHYRAVADAVPSRQIVYNIAGRTGVNISTETLVKLAAHDNIVAVKESSENIEQIMDVINQTSEDFAVLSGTDSLTYSLLALGGQGAISTISNLVPSDVKAMVDAGLAGDNKSALDVHYQLLPLARTCFIESNPIPLKTALAAMGLITEHFRPPMCSMEHGNREILLSCLEQVGIHCRQVN